MEFLTAASSAVVPTQPSAFDGPSGLRSWSVSCVLSAPSDLSDLLAAFSFVVQLHSFALTHLHTYLLAFRAAVTMVRRLTLKPRGLQKTCICLYYRQRKTCLDQIRLSTHTACSATQSGNESSLVSMRTTRTRQSPVQLISWGIQPSSHFFPRCSQITYKSPTPALAAQLEHFHSFLQLVGCLTTLQMLDSPDCLGRSDAKKANLDSSPVAVVIIAMSYLGGPLEAQQTGKCQGPMDSHRLLVSHTP